MSDEIRIKDLEIGRIKHEGIVRVDIKLARSGRDHETTEHYGVTNPWTFSVSATIWSKRNSPDCHTAGQIPDTVARLGTPEVAELCRLWKRWHLNDARGACVHMTAPKKYDPDNRPVCPETGYKYGEKWLVDVIPDEEIHAIRAVVDYLTKKENTT